MLKYSIAVKLILTRADSRTDGLPSLDQVDYWRDWVTTPGTLVHNGQMGGERNAELRGRIAAEICGMTDSLEACEAGLTYGPRKWGRGSGRTGALMCLGKTYLMLCAGRWLQALECSRRGLQDKGGNPGDRFELQLLSAIALHHLAQPEMARLHIERAQRICESESLPPALVALLACLREDMQLQRALRDAHPEHVYWAASRLPAERTARAHSTMPVADVTLELLPGFIGDRLRALRGASDLMKGGLMQSLSRVMNEIHRLRDAGCAGAAHELCMDGAHGALAAQRADWAELFIRLLPQAAGLPELGRVELNYVMSRWRALQGGAEESRGTYLRYVQMAMEMLGRQAAGHPAFVDHEHGHRADDYELRLPAKYRAVYRYMVANLADPALTVCALAARAGVTERALQSTFKAYLGKTPSELMQGARLERARSDMRDDTGRAISATEVGRRWGISRRSKLLSALVAPGNA
jgi:AraC-like DNA-binding protein